MCPPKKWVLLPQFNIPDDHTWASRGYWAPKYELVPKVTVDQKKTSTGEKVEIRIRIRNFFGPYELEIRNRSQIRIRIYVLDVFAVKIRIGPLIFPPIRRIRGGVQYPPPLAHVWVDPLIERIFL